MSFECSNVGTTLAPTMHEVGEAEGDASCSATGSGDVTITENSPKVTVSGNGTAYASLIYTGASTGPDQYDFTVSDGTNQQSFTSHTVNREATNDAPTCLGQQSADGPPQDLAIGEERFAGGCFDDEGETGPLTVQIVQRPSRGTLRIDYSDPTRPLVYYRATCSGSDDYSFTASDGVNTSAIYTGTVTNAGSTPCTAPTPGPVSQPAPAPAATFGLGRVPSTVTIDKSGNAVISVTGTPGSTGTVGITSDKAIASAKKKRKARKSVLTFGRKAFKVPASGVAKVKVKVSGKALKALKKAKRLKVKVTIKTDKTTVVKRITLKAPKAKKKASKKKRG